MGDVLFLILRRLRAPLVTLIAVYAISVEGLALIPALDGGGNPGRMSMFDRIDLSADEMREVMRQIMTGGATPIQIGGILAGLRTKGETVDEIVAAAEVMRELAVRIDVAREHLVDTCGTGGDSSSTFNVSTACAFVVAAAGGRVAKHGNRSMSSKSGSADVLEALGVNVEISAARVAECIEEINIGFLYAPAHHSAARFAAAPRKELGTRTLFNLLGGTMQGYDL